MNASWVGRTIPSCTYRGYMYMYARNEAHTYLDELELEELVHVVRLGHSEHHRDDVLARITQLPQMRHDLVGCVDVATRAVRQHVLHQHRVRLVAHLQRRQQTMRSVLNASDRVQSRSRKES